MRHVPTLAMWEAQEALDAMKLEVFSFRCFKKRTEFHRYSKASQVSETLNIEKECAGCRFLLQLFNKAAMPPSIPHQFISRPTLGFAKRLKYVSPSQQPDVAAARSVSTSRRPSIANRRLRPWVQRSLLKLPAFIGPACKDVSPSLTALRWRAGAVRGLTESDNSVNSTASFGRSPSSFEEDCRVIEECNFLINARLDIPL